MFWFQWNTIRVYHIINIFPIHQHCMRTYEYDTHIHWYLYCCCNVVLYYITIHTTKIHATRIFSIIRVPRTMISNLSTGVFFSHLQFGDIYTRIYVIHPVICVMIFFDPKIKWFQKASVKNIDKIKYYLI